MRNGIPNGRPDEVHHLPEDLDVEGLVDADRRHMEDGAVEMSDDSRKEDRLEQGALISYERSGGEMNGRVSESGPDKEGDEGQDGGSGNSDDFEDQSLSGSSTHRPSGKPVGTSRGGQKRGASSRRESGMMELMEMETRRGSGSKETWKAINPDVKVDCEKAVKALRRGNAPKAVKLMKEVMAKFPDVSLCHRVNAHIHSKLANMIDEPTTKQRHMRTALEAAQKATEISSNSIEFCYFYAQLLFENADGRDYSEVIKECERGLSIQDPVDPAKESLQEESQQEHNTPTARIQHVTAELRSLQQKANLASFSSIWRTIGGPGEERLRFLQVGVCSCWRVLLRVGKATMIHTCWQTESEK